MRGSTVLRVVAGVVLALILVGLGAGIYQAGMAQGIADAGRVPAGATVPAAGYGWGYGLHGFAGFGFGLFGIVWFLLFVLLLVGLFRFAFGFGRHRGHGWDRHGYGGFGTGGGERRFSEGPWADDRRRRFEELHRELHETRDERRAPGGDEPPRS